MTSVASIVSSMRPPDLGHDPTLAEVILLRTLMKNHPSIRSNIARLLASECAARGVNLSDDVWNLLIVAHPMELEDSHAHVIQ